MMEAALHPSFYVVEPPTMAELEPLPLDDEQLAALEAEAQANDVGGTSVAWRNATEDERPALLRDAATWRSGVAESLERAGAGTEAQYLEMVGAEPARRILAADELMARRFPELRWAIVGLIASGLVLLVSAPKIGKSWFGLSVAVATGGRALGMLPVDAGDVLVLALEDTARRLQTRLATILDDGDRAPSRLHLATSWPRLDDGGLAELRTWLAEHPGARLIVVDTLTLVRPQPAKRRDGGLYDEDYAALRGLKALADEYGVAIVAVHHTRKMSAVDPLDLVNGTHGLSGAADQVLVLQRERVRTDAKLHVMGRDVEEATHRLTWSPGAGTWTILDPVIADASIERREILDHLASVSGPRIPTAVATVLDRPVGSIKRLMWEMGRARQLAGGGRAGYTLATTYAEPNEPGTMEPTEPNEPSEPGYGFGSFSSGVLPARASEETEPTIVCSDYSAHRLEHRWVDGQWVCPACLSS
jgi:hypothetical protein